MFILTEEFLGKQAFLPFTAAPFTFLFLGDTVADVGTHGIIHPMLEQFVLDRILNSLDKHRIFIPALNVLGYGCCYGCNLGLTYFPKFTRSDCRKRNGAVNIAVVKWDYFSVSFSDLHTCPPFEVLWQKEKKTDHAKCIVCLLS